MKRKEKDERRKARRNRRQERERKRERKRKRSSTERNRRETCEPVLSVTRCAIYFDDVELGKKSQAERVNLKESASAKKK